ncbi:glycosyl hydrolase [Pyrenochaeta sp. MPI-SDFR-AT-0127]|nr:glycosyl hydrolase [Pyrenochaeta sp. MPI-SDFR-AT-0127]
MPQFLLKVFIGLLGLSSALTLQQTSTYPSPEPCTGNCTFIHDPSVVRRSDGTWLRFSTIGNIAVATAPALIGPWTYQGPLLAQGSSIKLRSDQELWAPDVFFANNRFYAYYSVSKSGFQGSEIGVATSETGEVGTWTDHGSVGVPKSPDYNIIDANFFRECDTCANLWLFGSAWKGVFLTSLSDDYLTWSGEPPHQVLYNSSRPSKPQDYPSITEGGFMFWWEVRGTKYYYNFFSSGACCNAGNDLEAPGDEYKIMVCRATTPTGPFRDKDGKNCATENGGTLVLGSHGNIYAPGGQGVIVDPDVNRIALYYHYADTIVGYEFEKFLFGFNYLDFSSGWPVVTV